MDYTEDIIYSPQKSVNNNKNKEIEDSMPDSYLSPSERRRIKIRLEDPKDPESIVCEIYDTSIENDKSPANISPDTMAVKTYFDVLMSKESRQSFNISSQLENSKLSDESRLQVKEDSIEILTERKRKKKKNKKNLLKLRRKKLGEKKVEANDSLESEVSSDDENLFQVQAKLKTLKNNTQKLTAEIEFLTEVKQNSTNRTKNIYDYFATPNTNQPSKKRQPIKKRDSEPRKLKEIDMFNGVDNKKKSAQTSTDKNVNKPKEKLAPLFVKKKVIDKEARQCFLQSGLPSCVVKTIEHQKTTEDALDLFSHFPLASHIQQADGSDKWNMRKIPLPLKTITNYQFENKPHSFLVNISKPVEHSSMIKLKGSSNYRDTVIDKYIDINVCQILDSCEKTHNKYSPKASKKRKSISEVENPIWTEKYQSCVTENVLGNTKTCVKFKKWLDSWKLFDEDIKTRNQSSDDFENSGESSRIPLNTCLIYGEIGCGKTNLIYTTAGELQFNVIEINASCKRTGKKVLSDLQEATQSHKIQNNPFSKQSDVQKISLILIEDADLVYEEHDDGFISALLSLIQSSKRPIVFVSNEVNCPQFAKLNLYQSLVLRMTRPSFKLTSCFLEVIAMLEGFGFQNQEIEKLVYTNKGDVRKSLLELQFIILSTNKKRLRKLSYPVKTTFDNIWWNSNKLFFNKNIKHDIVKKSKKRKRYSLDSSFFDVESSSDEIEEKRKRVMEPEVQDPEENPKKPVMVHFLDTPPNSQEKCDHLSFFNFFDAMSNLDTMTRDKSALVKDGISLAENMDPAEDCNDTVFTELSDFVVEKALKRFHTSKDNTERDYKLNIMLPSSEEMRWVNDQQQASVELTNLIPGSYRIDSRATYTDYLPGLRTMCRSEGNRATNNTKRRNRFLHYLDSIGLQTTDRALQINCNKFR